jgi:HSP20 family protein
MAESKTNRSETAKEGSQDHRAPGTLQNRASTGAWLSSPFEFMTRISDEMDRTFERLFSDFGIPRRSWLSRTPFRSIQREGVWAPRIEAFQKGDRFIVRADLPGLKKDDVQVEMTDDAITIHGERREEREEEREGYYHSEREYGQFSRTIPLPEGTISESAQATFKNGVLEISMQAPPAEASRGRRLEINEASDGGEKK